MIRVLHVIDSLDLGGAQTVLVNFARFHDRRKFEFSVAPMHGRGVFSRSFESGRRARHLFVLRQIPTGLSLSLPRLLRREHSTLSTAHLFGANWIGKPLAALCGVRVRMNHDHCNDRVRNGWCNLSIVR